MKNLKEIVEIIHAVDKVLITAHVNPDGDAIGSMLGFGMSLELMDKDVSYYNRNGVPSHLAFLPHGNRVRSSLKDLPERFDVTFLLDCTDVSRAGDALVEQMDSKRFGKTVIIDHHVTSKKTANVHFVYPDAPATATIIYRVIKELGLEISPEIATCLYTAILTDTGSFRFSNTTSESFRIAAELTGAGASPSFVAQSIYENEPYEKIKLLSKVLSTLEIHAGGKVASILIDNEMYDDQGLDERPNTEGFVNLPRSISGAEVAVFFKEEDGRAEGQRWKVSLRSKGAVNVSALAEKLDGGGHEKAAGCSVSGTIKEAKERVLGLIKEELDWKA